MEGNLRRRGSSASTVRAAQSPQVKPNSEKSSSSKPIRANLWVHDDNFSTEDVLVNDSLLEGSNIKEGDLIEIVALAPAPDLVKTPHPRPVPAASSPTTSKRHDDDGSNLRSRFLCLAKFAPADFKAKQTTLQVSIKSNIATAFGFRSGAQVDLLRADLESHSASHVEFSFRDAYIARSDMWRMIGNDLAGKTIYTGQRINYLGSARLVVKSIHVNGHKVRTGFFSGHTLPIFRSEAARYVIFIQMSREMWDFDAEGNGEIMFNRVVNGFLPDLFKRWTDLEVRHLVSIVLFSRQEYSHFDLPHRRDIFAGTGPSSSASSLSHDNVQDFYKVVVTDMASAQWTTILDELKKDFRVFLRDLSLHPPRTTTDSSATPNTSASSTGTRITGTLSSAMKGNILEAINIASTQFSNDYVDRDLIRTGISVVVVTAGTGIFEVERDLLNLTSENLTNNGIGIDVVCLSRMPLHSVPLFKYKPDPFSNSKSPLENETQSSSPRTESTLQQHIGNPHSLGVSPANSSMTGQSLPVTSRMSTSFSIDDARTWYYGIPHWIDLSYWAPDAPKSQLLKKSSVGTENTKKDPFVPRVRMYEVQMMGLMEMGMADISIPFLSESLEPHSLHRRRHGSIAHEFSHSRVISLSPKLSRRSVPNAISPFSNHGLVASKSRKVENIYKTMDKYDEDLFAPPIRRKAGNSLRKRSVQKLKSPTASKPVKIQNSEQKSQSPRNQNSIASQRSRSPAPSEASSTISSTKRAPQVVRAARNTSYALRGLVPQVRAVASTEINVENVQADLPRASQVTARPVLSTPTDSFRSLAKHGITSSQSPAPRTAGNAVLAPPSETAGERPSTPIKIHKSTKNPDTDKGAGSAHQPSSPPKTKSAKPTLDRAPKSSGSDADSALSSSSDSDDSEFDRYFGSLLGSVPKSNVAFVRNVNASNPLKGNANREVYFGRWQHLYPRKPRAATVKWRSLCTPASVPLTTEYFPSRSELETNFNNSSYTIGLENTDEILENPESRDTLFREMLSIRFAHGYQLVVGPRINRFEGPGLSDPSFFFNPDAVRTDGQYVFLSMGNTVQKLAFVENNCIAVTRYGRKKLEVSPPFAESLEYRPRIRTILSGDYRERAMELKGFSEEYPWEDADRYLAASKKQLANEVQHLRFWRARFVLLPVEPPANAYRPTPTDSEENDEETHLRGIRALTQMWQRTRFIPPEERRPAHNRMSAIKRKDRNPLSISMETLNTSELVATELDKLLAAEEAGDVQTAQLLPEDEQFERESAPLSKLAAAIQGERGIEIKNRRWHLRLHYSCFRGEEFTNWLVQNFRDIDTRDEAVELGNDLMKEGLFEHVNSRHNFKDGNFFYSIKAEHRLPRADLRASWFPTSRRSDRSVPATPSSEHTSKELPFDVKTKSQTSLPATLTSQATSEPSKILTEKKRLAVSLSKMIRIDVDVRKRSNRPEIVNLHYDRLHNPENCYHLELSWFNVTSKLVDDAIVSWTNQAEKYGLKLVEVPIAEAAKIPKNEPFRAPYLTRLSMPPPPRSSSAGNVYFTATSFNPQQPVSASRHFYQKALLRHFNFVLDLEAVSEFPENVEINYSWGKLDYQFTQFVHRSGVILAQITDDGDFLLLANRLYNSRLASTKTKDPTSKLDHNPAQGLRPPLPPTTAMQASGIIGVNVQSPTPAAISSPSPMFKAVPNGLMSPSPRMRPIPSPRVRPIAPLLPTSTAQTQPQSQQQHQQQQERILADVFGARASVSLPNAPGAQFITPEQIKNSLEDFCNDPSQLEDFYREVNEMMAVAQTPRQDAISSGGNKRASVGSAGTTNSSLLRPVVEVDDIDEEGFRLPESVAGVRRKGTS